MGPKFKRPLRVKVYAVLCVLCCYVAINGEQLARSNLAEVVGGKSVGALVMYSRPFSTQWRAMCKRFMDQIWKSAISANHVQYLKRWRGRPN